MPIAPALIWQLNDCWPAISWSAVDYSLIPKACYCHLRRAFQPDIVGCTQQYSIDYSPDVNSRGQLVASERDGFKAGEVKRWIRVDGEVLETRRFPVRLEGAAPSPGRGGASGVRARRFDCVAEFTLRWEDGVTARNVTYSRPKHMRLARPTLEVMQIGADRLAIRTDRFAKGISSTRRGVVFSDNYFDLMPGEAGRPYDPPGRGERHPGTRLSPWVISPHGDSPMSQAVPDRVIPRMKRTGACGEGTSGAGLEQEGGVPA